MAFYGKNPLITIRVVDYTMLIGINNPTLHDYPVIHDLDHVQICHTMPDYVMEKPIHGKYQTLVSAATLQPYYSSRAFPENNGRVLLRFCGVGSYIIPIGHTPTGATLCTADESINISGHTYITPNVDDFVRTAFQKEAPPMLLKVNFRRSFAMRCQWTSFRFPIQKVFSTAILFYRESLMMFRDLFALQERKPVMPISNYSCVDTLFMGDWSWKSGVFSYFCTGPTLLYQAHSRKNMYFYRCRGVPSLASAAWNTLSYSDRIRYRGTGFEPFEVDVYGTQGIVYGHVIVPLRSIPTRFSVHNLVVNPFGDLQRETRRFSPNYTLLTTSLKSNPLGNGFMLVGKDVNTSCELRRLASLEFPLLKLIEKLLVIDE